MSRIEPGSASADRRRATVAPTLARSTEILLAIGLSCALLIPCFWLPHIQTVDLSSHLYNAWLAGQIEAGKTIGLRIVPVWTNVLSDWILEWLIYKIGPLWAERFVAGAAVLLFFSGAFWLISVVTGRRPWLLAPCLSMLSYGLVFHLGFLNYYIATGLCLWLLALAWNPSPRRWWFIVPLAVLAMLAHAFPLIWAALVLAYLQIWRRVPPDWRFLLPLISLAALILAQVGTLHLFPSRWSPGDALSLAGVVGATGVQQVWVFGPPYLVVAGGLLLIWCVLFMERLDHGGVLADPVAQLWLLNLAACVLAPSAIQLPQYQHVLAYIPERVSLLSAILFCILVGRSRYGRGITRLSALTGIAFFTLLYLDGAALNRTGDEIAALIEALPPGQRVVAAVTDRDAHMNALAHVADQACIGRCVSYGNYEPATGQFRIRVVAPLASVAPDMNVVKEIEEGRHAVTAAESPLYSVCLDSDGSVRFELRELHAGEKTCAFSLPVTLRF